ncbi:MAG TPA: glycosyl hydrolase [Puia sp.]
MNRRNALLFPVLLISFAANAQRGKSLTGDAIPTQDAAGTSRVWPLITPQARPWTRWWWMGNAVDTDGLRINMEKYKDAGLGGVELTPVYGVKGYEDKFVNYLSPEWMSRFEFTLHEARSLGLGLDMDQGTGWPFGGGPLIDSVYACKELFYKTWSLHGGERLTDTVRYIQQPMVHTDGLLRPTIDQLVEPVFANKDLQALALFQVRFRVPLPLQTLMAYSATGAVIDLTGKVGVDGRLDWTAPAGDWTLYGLFQGLHGKMVERAAPGAEGNAIDYFSVAALTKYLSRFDTAFAGHSLKGLRAFFQDSYEVDDAQGQSGWTPGFFDLFRQYRGYDLRQFLPALFGKDKPEIDDRVLCDYRETISDLMLDKSTRAWGAWAHLKGRIIRDQAHGSPANILDLYAASDIPETEGEDVLRNKFAVSAAHVTGKKLVSSESVTWLNEHFLSSLGDVKKALDGFLLGGVNHIFYHGTAYSPPADPWPGWLFYASVHFTPNDPSWQNFHVLNNYIARCQSVLQGGSPDDDVLLYYPLYDSWSDRGRDLLKHYDKMDPEFSGTGFEECAGFMQGRGYTFDYISDKQLQQTDTVTRSSMTGPGGADIRTSGDAHYRTVLLPACTYLSVGAMDKLIRLAEDGATILVYKHLPSGPPGWADMSSRQDGFARSLNRLHFMATDSGGIQTAVIGKGVFVLGDQIDQLLRYAKIRREPMVEDSLQFTRIKYGTGNCYFIVNRRSREWKGLVPLAAKFVSAEILNPMEGDIGTAPQSESAAVSKKIFLQLAPGESCLVETSPGPARLRLYRHYEPAGASSAIAGKWEIKFIDGGPKLPASVTVDQLGSWTDLEGDEVKRFSGTASYSISFTRPKMKATDWKLDLGKVDVTAQVWLNGMRITTLLGPPYQVVIPASMMHTNNKLEIRVSNLMVNRIEDMDRQAIPWKKFYNYNFPPHFRENRGAKGLFDTSKWAPLASGLSGPVTLTPLLSSLPSDRVYPEGGPK